MVQKMNRSKKKFVIEYIYILLGTIIIAFAFDLFLVPNQIAAGGVSGLATVLYHLFGVPVGIIMLLLNLPLFLAGVRNFGGTFGVRTIFGAVSLSIITDLLAIYVSPLTTDRLLASVYGGILCGIGTGIIFRNKGTTGGSDIGARLLSRYTRLTAGQALMVIDFFVIAIAGIIFGVEMSLYAFFTLYITGKVLDFIQEGASVGKAAFIISKKSDYIAETILSQMDRGATVFSAYGAYTGQKRDVVLSVVSRAEIARLKEIVHSIDENAFVIITDVHEVLGEGFLQ